MCFSASVSFTAGAGLFVTGTIAVNQSSTIPQRVFACIPLVFAVQQVSEGLVWLSVSHAAYAHWQNISMYTYLVFAQVVWPSLVPFSILLFEKDLLRKKILYFLSGVGVLTSLFFSWCLLYYPVALIVESHHIKYQLGFPLADKWYDGTTYLLAAVVSPFVSGVKRVKLFGWVLLVSYVASKILYYEYLVSVWCFFAAILSAVILIIIRQLRNDSLA